MPLTTLAATATPLSYGSPPVASKVANKREVDVSLEERGFFSTVANTSSSTAAPPIESTTICTMITGSYPTSTVPAFCRPSIFVNAPALASPTGTQTVLPTAVVTMGANSVHDKITCCTQCANYYNCYAWRFVPSYAEDPSSRLPGGFDPWVHGNCEIAYYTGNGTDEGVTTEGAASICPNGRLQDQLDGTNNKGSDPWINAMYYNGWNEGACGSVGDVIFATGSDAGFPDGDSLCSV